MTEPDEALLWAREEWESWVRPTLPGGHLIMTHGYRAGAAASAERIKELEARVAELELFVAQIAHRFVPKKMPLGLLRANCWSESSQARALLKDPDK